MPTEVKNALQDVFEETDDIENVLSYFKEDLDELTKEMRLSTVVNLTLDGKSNGKMTDTWTYYGDIDFSLNEDINIVNENGESIQLITKTENEDPGIIYNKEDWAIILFEDVSWDSRKSDKIEKTPVIAIYCPNQLEEEQIENSDGEVYNYGN